MLREFFLSFEAPSVSDNLVVLCCLEARSGGDPLCLFSFEGLRSMYNLSLCLLDEEASDGFEVYAWNLGLESQLVACSIRKALTSGSLVCWVHFKKDPQNSQHS